MPRLLGGYRLLRVLGQGGMGKVYEAEDAKTGQRVALKLVSADYAVSAETLERFKQEGRLAGLIAHPRCVFVLAADEEHGSPYIVMELMPGANLHQYVRCNGPQPPAKAVALILDVIEGLQEAHRVGVIHRDMKPSNCFFCSDGRLKVGDFGLATSLAPGAQLTTTGSFLGTPLYASPELVRGQALDAQTDMYSTAATPYYLLTGRAPFQSNNPLTTVARIAAEAAPSMRTLRPGVPPDLDAVVLRALERERKNRWQSLDEFAAALRPFLWERVTFGSLGLRIGVFTIDLAAVLTLLWLLEASLRSATGEMQLYVVPPPDFRAARQLLSLSVWFMYFGISEGLLGCSPGKALFRLRVCNAESSGPPGFWRAQLRLAVFYLLANLGTFLAFWVVWPCLTLPVNPTPKQFADNFGSITAYAFAPFAGLMVGVGALMSTMRVRNGYRGLHEWLSGTRVVPLPRRIGRRAAAVPCSSLPPSRAVRLQERVGPFEVRRSLHKDKQCQVLLGLDQALGRHVILWLRPAAEPPLSAGRRELNRTTRLRWLAAGRLEEWQWDAFKAPGGCSLAEWVEAHGKMPWAAFQPLLQQLAEELNCAAADGTMPAPLSVDLAWVREDGGVVLLDTLLTGPPVRDESESAEQSAEKRALRLLGAVAILALEGRPVRPTDLPPAVNEPLPLKVAGIIHGLLRADQTRLDLNSFDRCLRALRNEATQVRRWSRLGQLLSMALFQALAFGWCIPVFGCLVRYSVVMLEAGVMAETTIMGLNMIDEAAVSDYVCAELSADPLAGLLAVRHLDEDLSIRRDLEKADERALTAKHQRLRRGGPVVRWTFEIVAYGPSYGSTPAIVPDSKPAGWEDIRWNRKIAWGAIQILDGTMVIGTRRFIIPFELVGALLGPMV
jgi:hypothetical protein